MARLAVPGVGRVHIRAGESDIAALHQVFGAREYDLSWPEPIAARIQARYQAIVDKGDLPIIVDAGANIGAASLWFAHRFPRARVAAVEPDPENVAVLRRNAALARTITLIPAAIGAERGHVAVHNNGLGWATQTTRADSGVEIVTVRDAFAASGGTTPFIVKVDIEGFEADLFATNLDWIDECAMIVIEPHDWMLPGQHSSANFQKAMGGRPFEIFHRGENLFYVHV